MRFLIILSLLFSIATSAFAESQTAVSDVKAPPALLTPPAATTPVQSQPSLSPEKPITVVPLSDVVPQPQPQPAAQAEKAGESITIEPIKIRPNKKNGVKVKIADKQGANEQKNSNKDGNGDEGEPIQIESVLTKGLDAQDQAKKTDNTLEMLLSLVELQKTLKQQIAATNKKLQHSKSDTEKQSLQEEIAHLDKQLNETNVDFERLATGVDSNVFSDKQETSFSWKEEVATLLEPSIKELKQLTAKARHKSELKDTIVIYEKQLATAHNAVTHIKDLVDQATDSKIKSYLSELLPAWQNMEKRIEGKLDLAERELSQLEAGDVSIVESTGHSIRNFFRDRGWYLLLAMATFVAILILLRLFARLVLKILPSARKEQRPIHVRVFDIFFQFFSVLCALIGLVLVLYLGEDWFLLSATIIFIFGLAWTVRQTVPKMWRQVRLMLNMGAIREGERVIYQGVPWKVEAINFFCKLHNPSLGMTMRIPIENITDLISRPFHPSETWFPCEIGDWVAIDGKANAKVVSLSPEMVEVVELGGRKVVYSTADFLSLAPANLSTNFFIRVVFGLSYDLQKEITTTVLEKLNTYIQQKFDENGFSEGCLSLSVDFLQAGASSLDVVVFANMRGDEAPSIGKIERSISRWCVECCNLNNWEIPFPQMTVHLPDQSK